MYRQRKLVGEILLTKSRNKAVLILHFHQEVQLIVA